MLTDTVDAARDDQREKLFARPQRFGFENGRHGDAAIPCRDEHQQIHHRRLEGRRTSVSWGSVEISDKSVSWRVSQRGSAGSVRVSK